MAGSTEDDEVVNEPKPMSLTRLTMLERMLSDWIDSHPDEATTILHYARVIRDLANDEIEDREAAMQ